MFNAFTRAAAGLALAATLATFVAGHAQAADSVRLLTARAGWQVFPAFYAADYGVWAKKGVEVKHTVLDSSASVMEAFVGGQGDMAVVNVGTAVNAFFKGVPLRIVAGTAASDYPAFAVSPDIKSFADLKGKKIAIWSIPSDATLSLDTTMAKSNMAPGRDYTYVRAPAPNVCETVERGQADVGIVFEPYASACLLKKAKRIAPAGSISFDPPKIVASSVLIVNADFLEKHKDTVKAVVAANQDAMTWARNNKNEVVKMLAKYSGQSAESIALSYDSAKFDVSIDHDYHAKLLERYQQAKLITAKPTDADLKKLYQTNLMQ
jgi:NitT/TauT family transport system substrate-binding protein